MRISIGVDAAKEVHWVTAVMQDGEVLLDRKLVNTAEDIGRRAVELMALGGERLVDIDVLGGIATLVSASAAPSTTANGARESATTRPSSPSPADASTSSGR